MFIVVLLLLTMGNPAKRQARRGGKVWAFLLLPGTSCGLLLLMRRWCRGGLLSLPLLAI